MANLQISGLVKSGSKMSDLKMSDLEPYGFDCSGVRSGVHAQAIDIGLGRGRGGLGAERMHQMRSDLG